MIIPVGHDKLFRRLPYLTITLIGLCTITWLITFPIELKQRSQIQKIYEEELFEIEKELFLLYVSEHPEGYSDPYIQDKFYKALEEGEIIDKDSEEYKEWEEVYTKFKTSAGKRVFSILGFKPGKFNFLNLITSIFVHGGFFHLFFNMLFLWLVGVNIEDYWGRPLFISLFLIGGIFSSLFYAIFNLGSTVPLIGASGAISAVMGAFAVRFYKTKIRFFYFFILFFRPIWGTFLLYAWFALGFWFFEQLFYAMITKSTFSSVAFFAHVGGFLFGLAAGFGMKYLKVEEKYLADKIEKQIEAVQLHPKLEEAFIKRDAGDTEGAINLLKEVLKEEPSNSDARLELARSLLLLERKNEASKEYEKLISQLYEKGKMEEVFNVYLEVYEGKLENLFTTKTQFRIATNLVSQEEYNKAVELFSLLVKNHPEDKLAPVSLLKTGRIFLQNIGDKNLGRGALEFLIKNYPHYSGIPEARALLSESEKG